MSETDPIAPHGGTLVDLLAKGDKAADLAAEAANLPRLVINERELSDLEMLAVGALSPLTGFQSEDDYHQVLETMHLTNGLPWAIPVVLGLGDDDLHRVGGADAIALLPAEGADAVAVLRVSGQFKRDKHKEALSVYRTDDMEHPGVKAMYDSGDTCVAGTLEVIALPPNKALVAPHAHVGRFHCRRPCVAAHQRVLPARFINLSASYLLSATIRAPVIGSRLAEIDERHLSAATSFVDNAAVSRLFFRRELTKSSCGGSAITSRVPATQVSPLSYIAFTPGCSMSSVR